MTHKRCRHPSKNRIRFSLGGPQRQHQSTKATLPGRETTPEGVVVVSTNNGHGFHPTLRCNPHARTIGRVAERQRCQEHCPLPHPTVNRTTNHGSQEHPRDNHRRRATQDARLTRKCNHSPRPPPRRPTEMHTKHATRQPLQPSKEPHPPPRRTSPSRRPDFHRTPTPHTNQRRPNCAPT
jgi:hypothetical protein